MRVTKLKHYFKSVLNVRKEFCSEMVMVKRLPITVLFWVYDRFLTILYGTFLTVHDRDRYLYLTVT